MEEKRKFLHSLVFPTFFLVLIWMVKIMEAGMETSYIEWGLYPLKLNGLKGILTAPLLHADFKHLFDNSIPLYLLSVALFYFYRPVSYRVFFLIWLITGLTVWIFARPSYHIGASGLVYGLASFLFFSGIIRNNINLLSISLLVVFMYGGLVWGIFPFDFKVSWESHLMGGVTGLVLSFFYRGYGPPPVSHEWPEDEDDEYPPGDDSANRRIGIFDETEYLGD
jgi:membrane associated rhomboid family serine protease